MNLNVYPGLSTLGYATAREFFRDHESEPIPKLASRVPSVAPIVLLHAFFQEARSNGELRLAAIDIFVRIFREHFPVGWNSACAYDDFLIVLADWSSEMLATAQANDYESEIEAVVDVFQSASIPNDWLPSSPADSFLQEIFLRAWPEM